MLISLNHDFVFLCNRKCASVSIETMLRKHSDIALLGPPEFRHADYRAYLRYLAPLIEESTGRKRIETVCLVREPLSWLYSFYRFRSRYELRDPRNPNHHKCTHGIPFRQFVRAYMQPVPPAYADVGCQFDFVRDDGEGIGVDRLFRYEDIDRFVRYMSRKIGQDLKIRYKNVSPKKNRALHVAALADRLVKTATGVFDLQRVATRPAEAANLPEDLRRSLDEFMRADHLLYAQAEARAGTAGRERAPRAANDACPATRH